MLTLGAVWGAYLLLRIGLGGSFSPRRACTRSTPTATPRSSAGSACSSWASPTRRFPRFKHTTLACPALAMVTLVADGLAGIVGRSVARAAGGFAGLGLWSRRPWRPLRWKWSPSACLSALILATWRRSGKALAFYDYYILCALGWFVVQAVYEGDLPGRDAVGHGATSCRAWSRPGRRRCATCRFTASRC